MKKYNKKIIDKAVNDNIFLADAQKLIFKEVIFDSIFRFLFITLFLIYSLLNRTNLAKLSQMTADTILNHEVVINPEAYYFIWMIVLLALLLIALILAINGIILPLYQAEKIRRVPARRGRVRFEQFGKRQRKQQ